MIKTTLIACMAAAVYGDAQVFHGVYGHGVGVIPHSVTVKDVVHTPAEVSEVVTPIVHNVAVGYAGYRGYGYGHHLGYRGYGYGLGYARYGYGHRLGYHGYGYGHGYGYYG